METSLGRFLLSRPTITDLVGTRVYSYYLPAGVGYPAIVYRVVSATHEHTIDDAPATGIMRCRIQLDLLSDKLSEVSVLNEQIRQELDGYSGPMSNATCIRSKLVNEIGFVTEPRDASDSWVYRRSVDYLVRYKIATPTLGVAGGAMGGGATVGLVITKSCSGGAIVGGIAMLGE